MRATVRRLGLVTTVAIGFFVAAGTPSSFADTAVGTGSASVGGGGISSASTTALSGQHDSVIVSGSWSEGGSLIQPVSRAIDEATVVPSSPIQDIIIRPNPVEVLTSGLLNCEATASAGAVATGITACYVVAPDGHVISATPQAAPGPLDAVATTAFTATWSWYTVCFQAEALFADGSFVQTELKCF